MVLLRTHQRGEEQWVRERRLSRKNGVRNLGRSRPRRGRAGPALDASLRAGPPARVPQPSRCAFAAAYGLATVQRRCAECQMQDGGRQNGLRSPRSRENCGVQIMVFEYDFQPETL